MQLWFGYHQPTNESVKQNNFLIEIINQPKVVVIYYNL